MGRRRAGILWLLAACGPLMLAGSAVGALVTGFSLPDADEFVQNIYPNIVFGAVLPVLGALILVRLRTHPIGWLFLGCGLASAATLPVYGYARLALYDYPGHLPLGVGAAWLSAWLWTLGFMPLISIGLLLFPTGRPPSPRWRFLLLTDAAAVILAASATAFKPGPLENHHIANNPLGIPLPDRVFGVLGGIGFALFAVGALGAALATFLRWYRGRAGERAQLTWFGLAVLMLVAGLLLQSTPAGNPVMLVAIPLLPVAVAVAILRHNLLGTDVVLRRSLVYGALTVVLLLTYTATVAALGSLLQGRADSTAALVATALVAVAFAPARQRLQRAADRLLYGERGNPYAVLTDVGRRLDVNGAATVAVLAEVAHTLATSLRLPYVRVEITGDGEPMSAESGSPTATIREVPLTYRGDSVGRLLVAARTPRDPFNATDLRLLDDLGRQIGVAAHVMLLSRSLQRSREGLVATREDERRRIRRDLHDGLGPALAGVALGLDAVHRLAATDAAAAAVLAEQLKREVHASLSDVRRLVEDLRPPTLDQLGLIGAVCHQADRISERDSCLVVRVVPGNLPVLPAAVEVAAYRIVTEALNNVARHAHASSCRVNLGMDGDSMLSIEVEDDGAGLMAAYRPGVGLTAMCERATELGGTCQVTPNAPAGTRVLARIPVVT
ncbi:MAG TPA: histidine kinase [Kribbella sp.]